MRDPKKAAARRRKDTAVEVVGNDAEAAAAPAAAGGITAAMDADELPKAWMPGDALEEGEELQFDPSAYDCLHTFSTEWPCLSFDPLRDELGHPRVDWPHTVFLVAGTQADMAANNALLVMRVSRITGKTRGGKAAAGSDDDDDDSESDSDDSDDGGAAGTTSRVLQARSVAHHGGINRVRSCPQRPHLVATWADSGHVQLWDVSPQLRSLADAAAAPGAPAAGGATKRQAPVQVFGGHLSEGFAMDWSPVTAARLASGDCGGGLHLWDPTPAGKWTVGRVLAGGGAASVEDIQWSPSEKDVLAAAGADGMVRIWDARDGGKPALVVKAHDSDCNVTSWSRLASCMLATGGDDGTLRIWDLRNFASGAYVAKFGSHRGPVTSVEWSPAESSVLATCSDDDTLAVWDLSLERDAEEERALGTGAAAPADAALPPQLLFVHSGMKDPKELHWHPHVPGLCLVTALDGFNVFRPSNL